MTEPGTTHPTLVRRLLLPKGEYRTGALRAMIRVEWFIRLRWLAIAGGGLVYVLDRATDTVPERPGHFLGITLALLVLNLVWLSWSRWINRRVRADERDVDELTNTVLFFTNAQMAVDLILLSLVIRILGGVVSPLVIFYVFHVSIAALLLTPLNALLQAIWALLLYSIVVFGECAGWIGGHVPLINAEVELPLVHSMRFVSLVYCAVAVGLLGIWYLVSRVGTTLDDREQELRRASEALVASHEAIDELQSRRARFMFTAAHQLKSPLAGIQTMAGLVRDGVISGDRIADTTSKIVRRCCEAIEQVNELLALARLKEEGHERHLSANTDLVATVRELIANFRDATQTKGIELRFEVRDEIAPAVRVDPRDLKDCLGNLIENAIKYSGDGKLVEVSVVLSNEGAIVSVRDEGLGIDSETLEHMFDEFRRGNQALAMQIPGSGLGLSIVREVLEHAGGRITICSAPGEGSTFEVWLPLVEADRKANANRDAKPGNGATISNSRSQQMEEIAYAGQNRRKK